MMESKVKEKDRERKFDFFYVFYKKNSNIQLFV